MNLDRVQARIRPRRPWEAVDLGFALVAAWKGPVYATWLAAMLPILLLVGVLGYRHPMIALLALWWIRPLLDRVPLHVLSRALFGEIPRWRSLLREVPRLWIRRLPRALLGHRFDLARSFTMPVDELERPRGSQRRARLRVLGRKHKEEAFRLTFTSFLTEVALALALIFLVAFLLPERYVGRQLETFWNSDEADFGLFPWMWLGAQTLAFLLLEPLYVAGGFCLYLNRRTQLEAWDLEIAFRRIGARLAARAPAGVAGAGRSVAALVLVILAAGFCPAWSQEAPAAPDPNAPAPTTPAPAESSTCDKAGCLEADRAIADVVADPVFGSTTKVSRWHMRRSKEDDSTTRPWLSGLGAALASTLEPVLWSAALIGLAAFVLMQRGAGQTTLDLDAAAAAEVLGMDLRRSSLPEDIPGEARRLLQSGESAGAVSLLFRGGLADLATRDRLPFRKGMTEGECVRLATRGIPNERSMFFMTLASAWTAAAYGHRPPPSEEIEHLITQWPDHFRSPS